MSGFRTALFLSAAALSFAADPPVTIANSGSTNTAGFRIVVERSGDAQYIVTRRRPSPAGHTGSSGPVQQKLPGALVQRFYADLDAAKPLSALPRQHCAKSASFGTTLTIQSGDDLSPDLSCPTQDARVKALMRDSDEIASAFHTK